MLVVYRNFLGESHPAAGERPEGVFGGRGERVDGARSESGAAREQAVVGEGVEGFSQDRRGVHDDLLQRVHRRGARLHRGIPRDLQLAHHLDGAVRSLGDGCLHRSLLIRQPVSEPTASSASTARLRQIPWAGRSRTRARRPQRYVA